MLSIFKINTNPEKRYFGFDIIRAFSVVLVMQMHFLQHFSQYLGINYFMLPLPDPVDMFFVCSGFLIGYQHLKEVHKTEIVTPKYTARFLVMRWVRTLPSYYIILTFLVVLFTLFPENWIFLFVIIFSFSACMKTVLSFSEKPGPLLLKNGFILLFRYCFTS
jgi:peptidoglycan/LPS O-acetylase OafA/YrhL